MKKILVGLALSGCACVAAAQNPFQQLLRQLPVPIPGASQQKPGTPQQPADVPQPGLGSTSVAEEIAIGRQLAGNLLGAVPLVKDDKLQEYVNKVGRWIAAQSERPDLNWYFGVLESNDINAFSLPGGYIFVTKGLFATLASESELAGVLGHEIGHVVMKHHLNVLQKSRVVGALGGLISSQVGGRGGTQDAMVQNLIGNGAQAVARGLDKDAEYEADRIGVVLAARAGYEPYGLPAFLQKLARVNNSEAGVALLFKTHPLPQDRLMTLGDSMRDTFDQYSGANSNRERFEASMR